MADHSKWILPDFRAAILRNRARDGDATDTDGEPMFQTISMRKDGISWDAEQQLRWTTCTYVEDLASLVEIPSAPCVLAQLYVQRFYMLHPFSAHDRFLVATAALFLAGKTEEFPIKVRLMTECGMFLLYCKPKSDDVVGRSMTPRGASPASNGHQAPRRRKSASGKPVEMSSSLGNNPEAANAKHLDCLHALLEVLDVGQIEMTAARVLLLERVLLQTLSFDLSIPQPFAYVAPAMEKVFALEALHPSVTFDVIRSLAFLFLADAVKSALVLAFDSKQLAVGAVYIACLYRNHVSPNVTTEKNEPWWTVWAMPVQQLEDVARGILWMYEDSTGKARKGLSDGLLDVWTRYRPQDNLPDLDYVRRLDAELLRSPQ